MVSQLTTTERQLALVILAALGLCGLAMASAGHTDPFGIHGMVVLLASIAMAFVVLAGYHAPEPGSEQRARYYDDPSRSASCSPCSGACSGCSWATGWPGCSPIPT